MSRRSRNPLTSAVLPLVAVGFVLAALAANPLAAAEQRQLALCRGADGVARVEAIAACSALLQGPAAKTNRAMVLGLRGRQYYLAEHYDAAISDFDAAIALDDGLAQPVHYRGLALAAKGETDRAIADFSRVIALDPAFSAAYFRRGLAYYSKNDFDHAIADFDRAIARDSTDGMSYHYRGLSHFKRGEAALAVADFSEVIKRNSNDALALYNRGNAYAANTDAPRALADYNRAVTLDGHDIRFLNARAELRRTTGNLDGALADLDAVLQLKPGDRAALLSRSSVYAAKGDQAKSEADYAAVIATQLQQAMLYPSDARDKHEQGNVRISFAIDRDGKVTSSAVTAASNNALFDREALAMIRRAEPFPSPSLIGKDNEEFATTIQFKLF